jgi:hypothetical protein
MKVKYDAMQGYAGKFNSRGEALYKLFSVLYRTAVRWGFLLEKPGCRFYTQSQIDFIN